MNDDWMGDPFADPKDPEAAAREQRRREREEKRQKREAKRGEKEAAAAPPPPLEPSAPPAPPRTPEQEFWDEPADEAAPVEGAAHTDDAPDVEEPPEYHEAERAADLSMPKDSLADEGLPLEQIPHGSGHGRAQGSGRDGGGSGGAGVLGALRRHPFRIVAAVVALIVVWFLWSLFQPFHGDGSGQVAVTIPKGAGVGEVGDLLEKEGVVDDSTFFQLRVTLEGKRSELYAGRFTLAHGMSYGAAIDALSKPPAKKVTTVTIPEGYSRSQAASLVKEDGLEGNYMKETVRSKYLNPAKYGGKGAKDLEGFLFPDTFELKPGAPVADLVQLQLQDFKRRIKGVDMSYAKSKNLTVYDVLTIASIIEHEAGLASQRKLVAAVFYNRLHEGMSLGSDATVRFATGNFSKPLTESELATDSPYNTRRHPGLPPGPIDSPGLAAIEAAAQPAKGDYLFFVTSPDCRRLAFSKTEAEFERDVARYDASDCTEGE